MLAVYRGWGIGSKENDGFLLLLAIDDRKYYTEVGYHLEGDLNDGLVGQIQRERLVPQLKKGNYSQGVYDTVQAYVATLAEKRGFSVDGIDQRYAYREQAPSRGSGIGSRSGGISSPCCTLLIIGGVLILLLSLSKRGGRGGGGGGCLNLLLLNSLLNSGSRAAGVDRVVAGAAAVSAEEAAGAAAVAVVSVGDLVGAAPAVVARAAVGNRAPGSGEQQYFC